MNNQHQGNSGIFYVRPVWDEEARVYYSDSNIFGLHIEAETKEEFDALVQELAPDLILENHIMRSEAYARELQMLKAKATSDDFRLVCPLLIPRFDEQSRPAST